MRQFRNARRAASGTIEARDLPGRGHWVHDEDPAGVGAVIGDFLATLDESVTRPPTD